MYLWGGTQVQLGDEFIAERFLLGSFMHVGACIATRHIKFKILFILTHIIRSLSALASGKFNPNIQQYAGDALERRISSS